MHRLAGFAFVVLAGVTSAANACGFHNYTPQPTLVDRLIDSEHAVLARQDPENPFRFKAIEDLSGVGVAVEIPQLVDSTTRRLLTLNEEDAVLFAREGAYGPWQRIAYVDSDMQPVLRSVLDHLADWKLGEEYSRFEVFAQLLNHPDPVVAKLALSELDRVDYGLLVSQKLQIDTGKILSRIDFRTEMNLRPIRVLLLGIAGGEPARAYVKAGLERAAKLESAMLGAFATAMIEIDGPESVKTIADTYLLDPTYSAATREMLIEAFALHSQYGDDAMHTAVNEAMGRALEASPELAPAVARQFGARGVWSQREALSSLIQNGSVTSMADVLTISQYIALAEGVSSEAGIVAGPSSEQRIFE